MKALEDDEEAVADGTVTQLKHIFQQIINKIPL